MAKITGRRGAAPNPLPRCAQARLLEVEGRRVPERAGQLGPPRPQPLDLEVARRSHGPGGPDAVRGRGLEAEVGVPPGVAEQDDRRLSPRSAVTSTAATSAEPTPWPWWSGCTRDRAEAHRRPLAHRSRGCTRRGRRPRRAARRRGSGRRARRRRRGAGRGCGSRASARHPPARRTPRRAGPGSAPRHPGSSRRSTRAGSTGSSSQAGRAAGERVQRVLERRPSRSTRSTSSSTASPSSATSRSAASSAGAQERGPHDEHSPGRERARAPPRVRRRGTAAAFEACTRKSGPLSTSSRTTSHGPRGRRHDRTGRRHVGDDERAPLPLDARQLGDQRAARPPDERRRELDDVDVPHPRVGEHGPGREPEARARRRAPGAAPVPAQRCPRQGDLAGGVDGVHGEGAVDDELEHRAAAPQRHLAVRGGGAGHRHGLPVRHVGVTADRRHGIRCGNGIRLGARHAPTLPRDAERAGAPVVAHRRTRPSRRGSSAQRRSRPSSLSSRRTASPEPGPKAA